MAQFMVGFLFVTKSKTEHDQLEIYSCLKRNWYKMRLKNPKLNTSECDRGSDGRNSESSAVIRAERKKGADIQSKIEYE